MQIAAKKDHGSTPRRGLLMIVAIAGLVACAGGDADREVRPATCASRKLTNDYIVHWRNGGATRVRTDGIDDWLAERRPDITAVEANYRLNRAPPAAGNFFTSTAELQTSLGLDAVWDRAIVGAGISVAVIDTGIDLNHPLLKDQLLVNEIEQKGVTGIDDDGNGYIDDIYGWNANADSPVIVDELGHGTSVAGLISGPLRNGVSLAVAPGAKILPVDFIIGESGTEFDAKKGIDYAIKRGVNIINNSWSIPCSDLLRKSFASWSELNVLFVNAAGNEPIDVTTRGAIPSSLVASNFLNVGSVDGLGKPSVFSGYGSSVGIFVLGEDLPILGRPLSGEGKPMSSGTSLSAAIVSGAAALVWSARPELTASQVGTIITNGPSPRSGGVRVLDIPATIERARRFQMGK